MQWPVIPSPDSQEVGTRDLPLGQVREILRPPRRAQDDTAFHTNLVERPHEYSHPNQERMTR